LQTNMTSPIVVSLGKTREQHVSQLRIGIGPMVEDLQEVMRLVRENVDLDRKNRVFLPIVVVYTEAQ
jgi:hypothetical protein